MGKLIAGRMNRSRFKKSVHGQRRRDGAPVRKAGSYQRNEREGRNACF